MMNPFKVGGPVNPEGFVGREKELKEILFTLHKGDSIALIGEPRIGKTSLLYYLLSPNVIQSMSTITQTKIVFQYVDLQAFQHDSLTEQFLKWLIHVLETHKLIENSPLVVTKERELSHLLNQIFIDIERKKTKFVLLIDNLDSLADLPDRNAIEFYSLLQGIITEHESISLIAALAFYPRRTFYKEIYDKFVKQLKTVHLNTFSLEEAKKLLDHERFSEVDKRFLLTVAGGYPFLLQVSAHTLWNTYEQVGYSQNERLQLTFETLMNETDNVASEIWDSWSPKTREVAVIIALATLPKPLQEHKVDFSLADNKESVRELVNCGYLVEDNKAPYGFRASSAVLNHWTLSKLISLIQSNSTEDISRILNNGLGTSFTFAGMNAFFKQFARLNVPSLSYQLAGDSTTDAPPPDVSKKKKKRK